MSNQAKADYWRKQIATCEASGLSISAWCSAQDISADQYRYWKKKFKANQTSSESKSTEWSPLIICDKSEAQSKQSVLTLSVGKYKIEVREDFNPKLLKDVLKVLDASC